MHDEGRRGWWDRADAWVQNRGWLADGGLAILLAALFAPVSIQLVRDGGLGPGWTGLSIGALVVLHGAVAFRRWATLPAFGAVALAELVLALAPGLADPQGGRFAAVLLPSSLGYLIVAYTVSARTDAPWRTVSLVVGLVGAVIAAGRSAMPGQNVIALSALTGFVVVLAPFFAMVVAAWALGGFRRLRAQQVAALRERARAAEADRADRDRRAAADERARIARELHDVVAHSLSVMVRQAEAGRYVAAKDPAAAATALATVAETGREALTDMRALLGVLGSDSASEGTEPQPTLDDVPTLVERVRASGQQIRLRIEGEPRPLDRAAHLAAYRVVQEALTNVVKHAAPSVFTDVELSWMPAGLRVRVNNTGSPGTSPSDGSGRGKGLLGMRERVSLAGGLLRTGPRGEGGFEVEAQLPIAGGRLEDLR